MPVQDVRLPYSARHIGFETIGSTNAEALRLAGLGETGPLWVTAGVQTEGRGRNGRNWVSEKGNLYASLLITLSCPPIIAAQLSLVAGLAVYATLEQLAPSVPLSLKWPNDVLTEGACKLSGILIESMIRPGGGVQAVLGHGLNLAKHPVGIDRPATDLRALGVEVTAERALLELSRALQRCLETWDEGMGFGAIRTAWLAASLPIGSGITLRIAGTPESGTFLGLADDGAMLFGAAGAAPRRVTFGDVNVLPAPAAGT